MARVPPANAEAEQCLLGTFLCDNRTFAEVSGFLLAEHFSLPVHARIYAAIAKLIAAGDVAYPVTLKTHFDNDNALDAIGGSNYLAKLAGSPPTLLNAKSYALVIVECARRRGVILAADALSEAALEGTSLDQALAQLAQWTAAEPVESRYLTGGDFVRSYTPPDWLVDGILERGRLYACTSLTGHGKTAVWLYIACMMQAGRYVAHLDTEASNVMILAGENPEDLKTRMLGMMRAFNLKPEQLPLVLPATFPLGEVEARNLCRELDLPLALIIVDTAASFFPGDDENDNVQAGQYARIARTLNRCQGNPAVVLLAHPIKAASRDNLLPRGGGAFLNELDGNLSLWANELSETTTLHWQGKIRGPDFDPLTFRLKTIDVGRQDTKGRPIKTVVAQPIDDVEALAQANQTIADEDAVLRRLSLNPNWSQREIATAIGWIDDNGKGQGYRVHRALKSLARDKLVRFFRGKWQLTEAGKQAAEKAF
jgi:hypothetical protein